MMTTRTGRTARRDAYGRAKAGWNGVLGVSVVLAALAHLGVLSLWPRMEAPRWEPAPDRAVEVIEVEAASHVEPPAPPEVVFEPELPQVPATLASLELIGPELPQAPATLASLEPIVPEPVHLPESFVPVPVVPELPDRMTSDDPALSRFIAFAPHMARPRIRNLAEVESFMLERYRPYNEATGVEGEVVLDLWIDEVGEVQRAGILESSGDAALDRLGLELVRVVEFTPARNGVVSVAVNVAVPILFERVVDN